MLRTAEVTISETGPEDKQYGRHGREKATTAVGINDRDNSK